MYECKKFIELMVKAHAILAKNANNFLWLVFNKTQ